MAWSKLHSNIDVVSSKASFTTNKLGKYALKESTDNPPTVSILTKTGIGLDVTSSTTANYWDFNLIPTAGLSYEWKLYSYTTGTNPIILGSKTGDYECGIKLLNFKFTGLVEAETSVTEYGGFYKVIVTITPSQNGTYPMYFNAFNNNGTTQNSGGLYMCEYVKVYNGTTLVADLHAAQTTSTGDVYIGKTKQAGACAVGTYGFYDNVAARFYVPYTTDASIRTHETW